MVTASFGLGVLLGGLVLAFIAVRSGVLMLIIPGILGVLWFATTTEIRMVTVEGNDKEYAMFLALPGERPPTPMRSRNTRFQRTARRLWSI